MTTPLMPPQCGSFSPPRPMRRSRRSSSTVAVSCPPIVRLWMLRCLVLSKGHQGLHSQMAYAYGDILAALGLEPDMQPQDQDSRQMLLRELCNMHKSAEQGAASAKLPTALRRNMAQLATLVDLDETSARLLELIIMLHRYGPLKTTCECLGELSSAQLPPILAQLLDRPVASVRASLSRNGILQSSGLLSIRKDRTSNLHDKLRLLSIEFAENMLDDEAGVDSLLEGKVSLSDPAQLSLSDYPHIRDLSLLRPYLRQALASPSSPVNILFHGPPGTGKSQLARVLAQDMDCQLLEITSEDSDGDPLGGEERLRALRAAQYFFAKHRALILFDEIEDVFGASLFNLSVAQSRKAWMNRTLENNRIPTLWLSNDIEGMDPAFIRRFDMIVELPVPPKAQRERITQALCGDIADADAIARIATPTSLAPAVVARAANVVRTIHDQLNGKSPTEALESLINNTLIAQGHSPLHANRATELPDTYDPSFINADSDLAGITTMLGQSRSARLCLYGPPGTGKTAYGRWLARQLDMPLLVKRASDLLSPYVGITEKQIAGAFHTAQREGALLMIDEVDSFLRDRQGLKQDWEATMVNEMLTQMESSPGIFIASTNLMDGLDPAALRRFDLKAKFDYLLPAQAAELLRRHCEKLGFAAPGMLEDRVRLHLPVLTPGDFAMVVRQHRFQPLRSFDALFAALRAECALKKVPWKTAGGLIQ